MRLVARDRRAECRDAAFSEGKDKVHSAEWCHWHRARPWHRADWHGPDLQRRAGALGARLVCRDAASVMSTGGTIMTHYVLCIEQNNDELDLSVHASLSEAEDA